jgi:4-amino-4-deoxy-L-arabinose transferase-like glycosyltransferase
MSENGVRVFTRSKAVGTLKVILYSASAVYALAFLFLAFLRLRYPYEVEWLEGVFMEHLYRVTHGEALYIKPTIDFIPFGYPPLYYFVVAPFAKVLGFGFFAPRLVSFLSTLGISALIARSVFLETERSWLLAVCGAGLFLASYAFCGYYYDVVRIDMLTVFFIVAAGYSAAYGRGWKSWMFSAVLLTLGFFTKQQAIFFYAPIALWLYLNDRKDAVSFIACSVILAGAGYVYFETISEGWFSYYVFGITTQKAGVFLYQRALEAIPLYLVRYWGVLVLLLVLFIAEAGSSLRSVLKSRDGLQIMLWLTALGVAVISLGNDRGYRNLLIPFAAYSALLVPVLVSRNVASLQLTRATGLALLLVQFVALYYDPTREKMVIASNRQRAGGDEFVRYLKSVEGEVYLPDHSYISRLAGKKSFTHTSAAIEVYDRHDANARELAASFDSAFLQHRFAQVIFDENKITLPDSVPGYTLGGKIFTTPHIFLSRLSDEGTRPQFIYLPK